MITMIRRLITVWLALAGFGVGAEQTPWQKIEHPIASTPSAIGSFANGCNVGAQPLPLKAGNHQVLRPGQRRYFGYPDLLLFIQCLNNQVKHLGLGEVLVGNVAMPAGGRFSSWHASYQSGLDAHIWLQTPC